MTTADALGSIMRSTWDRITPELRGIAYLQTDEALRVRFIYEHDPDEDTVELVSFAETECIADFWQTLEVTYVAEGLTITEPRLLHDDERWAYLRYEAPMEA